MALAALKFTDPLLRSLKVEEGQTDFADSLTPGLLLRVGKRTKTFMFRRVLGGRRERITIGRYPDISLAKAREEGRKLRAEKTLGLAAPKVGPDWAECLEEFLAGKRGKNKASTVDEKERLLKRHFPFSGDVTEISDRQVSNALKAIKAPSERRHAYVEARTFFNWLVKARRLPYSPLVAFEPPRKGEDRERVLSDDELVAVWLSVPQSAYGQIIRLIIITGQRPGQIGGLKGAYVVPNELVISWPGEAMKGNRRHAIPLTDMVADIINMSRKGNSYEPLPSGLLFPTKDGNPFGAWARNKARLDTASGVTDWVHQDLRRTWATKAADWEIADPYIIERILAHQLPGVSQVGPVYNRAKYLAPMRLALEQFELKLMELVRGRRNVRDVCAA